MRAVLLRQAPIGARCCFGQTVALIDSLSETLKERLSNLIRQRFAAGNDVSNAAEIRGIHLAGVQHRIEHRRDGNKHRGLVGTGKFKQLGWHKASRVHR